MRVFVLTTGRSGSTTWFKACSHITNYTAAHESRGSLISRRLDYPDDHIEVDNRLSWFLGTLDLYYGDSPLYVWLKRDHPQVVESYARRFRGNKSIIRAMAHGIIMQDTPVEQLSWQRVSELTVTTVEDNIRLFLKDKTNVIEANIDAPAIPFSTMWTRIGARGDFDAALGEFKIRHNRTPVSTIRRENARKAADTN